MNRTPYTDRKVGTIKALSIAAGISAACALMPSMAMAQCTGSGNLVANGGFETGSFANWTVAWPPDVDPYTTVSPTDPHSGNFAARLGPVPGENSLSQVINGTTAGSVYTVCFWLEHDSNSGSANNSFAVRWDGLPVLTLVNSLGFDYILYEFTVRATGSDTLRFDAQEVPAFWNLDDVGVFPGGPTPFVAQVGAPTKK